ncbi:hypothetical protein FPZ43_11095 [Mucilaginibacter pallidiroseus]|uniref:Vitellogenin II n=1 Tax=Mucilaginibacter pallidiroseus TaxID=2599295 RepID=A0A563UBV8_9SPHI|nr:hypothetical protein [Mucilaginibacter pallidiroseus]TWR28810.1 hypothetical protein FPZ43_11095 [Mucilaginibacter pallidiroseus]
MKRNLIYGIIAIGAIALSSCSVSKTASTANDDVYFSKATAAEEPQYAARQTYNQDAGQQDSYYDGGDDDYFYYDDYASRINRFSYYSPFGYYDYAYSPYGYGYGGGWNIGLGYGWGGGLGWGGYGGWGLGLGYGWGGYGGWGYNPWGFGYSPYYYWGTGWGGGWGGGYPYWGGYSAYNGGNARPNRGNGNPGRGMGNANNGLATRGIYNGRADNGIGYYPGGRAVRDANGMSVGRPGRNGSTVNQRPTARGNDGYQRPQIYQQPAPQPSSSSFGGGGSRGGGGSSGGGGGRPGRP